VARSLGLKRAADAHAAFLRALRRRQGVERDGLIERETARLLQLETRIRTRDAEAPEKMERRLVALTKLREGLA
jgi:murein L,D-transpeptidase YcbB/YkuD